MVPKYDQILGNKSQQLLVCIHKEDKDRPQGYLLKSSSGFVQGHKHKHTSSVQVINLGKRDDGSFQETGLSERKSEKNTQTRVRESQRLRSWVKITRGLEVIRKFLFHFPENRTGIVESKRNQQLHVLVQFIDISHQR